MNFFVAFLLGNVASAKTENAFYVLGSDEIYIIDPVEKTVVKKITNTTSPGLCSKRNNKYAMLISQNIIFSLFGVPRGFGTLIECISQER